jgi:hypothetical protein
MTVSAGSAAVEPPIPDGIVSDVAEFDRHPRSTHPRIARSKTSGRTGSEQRIMMDTPFMDTVKLLAVADAWRA